MDRPNLDDVDLNTTDRLIIAKLREGRATPGYLAGELGKRQSYINQRLGPLVEADVVEKVDRGLYGLVTTEGSSVDAQVLVDRLDDEDLVGGRVRLETGKPADRPPEEPALSTVNPGVEVDEPAKTGLETPPPPDSDTPPEEDAVEKTADRHPAVREALEGWDPGKDADTQYATELTHRAVMFLRDRGEAGASKSDFVDAFGEELDQSVGHWWGRCVRPGIRRLKDAGLVEGDRKYYWVGPEDGDEADTEGAGGVYDSTEEF